MSKKATKPLMTNVLSFCRSVEITEGLMFGIDEAFVGDATADPKRVPIEVVEKGVRGQTSNVLTAEKAGTAANSNIQTVEAAYIPIGSSGLSIDFSLRIMPMSNAPQACNDPEVGAKYTELAEAYAGADGYRTLAELYLWNIASGRFAWRNRMQADEATVSLTLGGTEIRFDPFAVSMNTPASVEDMAGALKMGSQEDLEMMISAFERGLIEKPMTFRLSWLAAMPQAATVYPSEEYVREGKIQKDLSRVLAKLNVQWGSRQIKQASMHSQKCGAALRHIDIWHGSDEHGAIAVNAYGGVQQTGEVLRPVKGENFYAIRKAIVDADIENLASMGRSEIPGNIHFLMANLLRGGVYGEKE